MTDAAHPAKVRPETILTAPRRPIARYRPAVIAALAGGLMLLVGLAFWVGFRGPRQAAPTTTRPAEAASAPPNLDRRLPATYDDPLAIRPQAEPTELAEEPTAPAMENVSSAPDANSQWIQEQEAARASGPFFGGPPSRAPPSLDTAGLGAAAASAALMTASATSAPSPARTAKEQFVAAAASSQDVVPHLPSPPVSRLEVKAGAIISAALVTGLNSDLPGPAIAQVTEPVFDHLTGRRVLIPQGARLIGRYDSQVSYGQDRALVVWTRIVFPDGRSLNIGAMTGADMTGAGGLSDRVDAHVPALARAIGLSSLISMGAAAAQNSLSRGADNLVLQDGAGGLSASASQTGQRLVDRDLQRQPTLRVRPGWPVRVLVEKDLIFGP